MRTTKAKQKDVGGLRNSAISLAFGTVSLIFAICWIGSIGPWIRILLASPLFALVGLFFGAIGLKSTGKGKYLAVAVIVVCSLALVASLILLFTGGLYYILTS